MNNNKRFECYGGYIKDHLTGWDYHSILDTTELLNQVSDRADRNAELLDIDLNELFEGMSEQFIESLRNQSNNQKPKLRCDNSRLQR